MKICRKNQFHFSYSLLCLLLALFLFSGCAGTSYFSKDDSSSSESSASTGAEPYYPTDFKDILVPGELTWNRENSMLINTASFAGGILNFNGKVEMNSLSDFFINTMKKNGWNLSGSVKYKNVMLAFTKADKTCMITMFERLYTKTEVFVYISESISGGDNPSTTSENAFQ